MLKLVVHNVSLRLWKVNRLAFFFISWQFLSHIRMSQHFTQTEVSFLCSQKPANGLSVHSQKNHFCVFQLDFCKIHFNIILLYNFYVFQSVYNPSMPIPATAPSKASVCGRSLAGIVFESRGAGHVCLSVCLSVCCECCVLSGGGLWYGLMTRQEEFCRVWCVMCDLESSSMWRSWPALGCSAIRRGEGVYFLKDFSPRRSTNFSLLLYVPRVPPS